MAVATGGNSTIALDYKFDFSIRNFNEVAMGETVFSDNFGLDGVSWQLEVKKIPHSQLNYVQVECRLHLVNGGATKKPKLARICLLSPYSNFSPAAQFERTGDKCDSHPFVLTSPLTAVFKVGAEVFKCCLKVAGPKPQIKPSKSEMASQVSKWFESEDFGDVTLVASDGKKFRCHRDILARRSEVFGRMFNTPMKESEENLVDIDGYEGDIVEAMLQFVYIDGCGEIGPIAERLYPAAHQFELDRLKILCESAMASNLSANSVVKTYRLATFYHLDQLLAICVDFLDSKAELPVAQIVAEAMKLGEEPEAKRLRSE